MKMRLKEYLPHIFLKTYEFPIICSAEQYEIDVLSNCLNELWDCQFVLSATQKGIERYEKIFCITPYDTDTLDERRFRILSKINVQLPFTVRMLRQQLALLCGEDGFTLDIIHDEYRIEVRVALTLKRKLDAINELLDNILPANIEKLCSFIYNEHFKLKKFTFEQLAGYTHKQLRDEIINPIYCTNYIGLSGHEYSNLCKCTHIQLRNTHLEKILSDTHYKISKNICSSLSNYKYKEIRKKMEV